MSQPSTNHLLIHLSGLSLWLWLWLWLWLCGLALQPANAIVCYHCDSIALPECAQTLGEVGVLPYKECATELTCAMSIVDSITYRGCGAETPTTEATYAKRCSSNLCNTGVYPPGRLKCHHCAGESCVGAPAGKPRPCRYHHEEDQCYTEIVSSTMAYRGCRSDTNHTAAATAQLCEINGCNDALGAWTLRCATCDSLKARGCKMDLFQLGNRCNVSQFEQCEQQMLLGQEQEQYCYTYRHLGRVVRGCAAELPKELETQRAQLETCASGDNCNAGCLPQQRCLSCNSLEKETCRSNATALMSQVCGSAEASSCYTCEYTNGQLKRGCGAPPTDPQILDCYECDGNSDQQACNSLDFTRCYRCSSDYAAGCANWEKPGGIDIERCTETAAPCLVVNYINGTTERGCQRTDFNCDGAAVASCRSCEGSFCNKGAYPEQRLWCHQCSNCEQVQRGQDAVPCGLLANEPTDQSAACLEYYDAFSKQVMRGCRSNGQLYYECMLRPGGQAGCRLCQDHGCNSTPGQQLRGALQLSDFLGQLKQQEQLLDQLIHLEQAEQQYQVKSLEPVN
ncbi:hypothetical protein AWZ03_005802 [Drosophila navojoa]|uniref:DUF753 domain-containing protein n=1 Tax=Drosophila navojoa TaxID=7232 RepID=A0A484BGG9_DRONA|nr:uncharacterized protein LOC108649318 [Drosophila navojoa]TDG47848.1 hypothetical protein AWZ03_005802 [Drosophila navojoa]